ncbi:hypothetical protein BZG36_04307 [Bifiguratus adelaidae]|uniref:Uncharacterized protein n=1 Tax=Bifiguratus adelaidae TaxID=1938954 RepID=A0A261Y008_9FUNG|nr:hypothetical protein BZG36_04307 [Bifiguratus adelaidae]
MLPHTSKKRPKIERSTLDPSRVHPAFFFQQQIPYVTSTEGRTISYDAAKWSPIFHGWSAVNGDKWSSKL